MQQMAQKEPWTHPWLAKHKRKAAAYLRNPVRWCMPGSSPASCSCPFPSLTGLVRLRLTRTFPRGKTTLALHYVHMPGWFIGRQSEGRARGTTGKLRPGLLHLRFRHTQISSLKRSSHIPSISIQRVDSAGARLSACCGATTACLLQSALEMRSHGCSCLYASCRRPVMQT